MIIVVLTGQKNNDSPEEVFPDEPVFVVQHSNADVLVPQDVYSHVAGEAVGDEDRECQQALHYVGKTSER